MQGCSSLWFHQGLFQITICVRNTSGIFVTCWCSTLGLAGAHNWLGKEGGNQLCTPGIGEYWLLIWFPVIMTPGQSMGWRRCQGDGFDDVSEYLTAHGIL